MNYHPKHNRTLGEFGIKDPIMGELFIMKAKVEQTIKISDGKHEGIIERIEYREEPYNYVDIVIKEKEQQLVMKCGMPFSITENTALGQALIRFGARLKVGEEVEVEDYLKDGLMVEFMTLTEKTKKGTFARIVSESLKPKA